MNRKVLSLILSLCFILITVCGCNISGSGNTVKKSAVIKTKLPKIDNSKWHYKAECDVYYQYGLSYCEKPVNNNFEKLAVFVPGAYMTSKKTGKNTYICKLNKKAKLKGYTAASAPVVMPIDTPDYLSSVAFTKEILETHNIIEQISEYTSEGFVFVDAGCRGTDEGAPTGVTDLKAAVRYLRYLDNTMAGDAEKIFVYGVSGGGAQATILGASGDSDMYEPYLKKIGAIQGVSDSIAGTMAWCPITDLKTGNAEYEWMMGSTRKGLSDKQKTISNKLAKAFADYINTAGFTDNDGNVLTLNESKHGIYHAGSYYEYIKSVIEQSLNNFISDAKLKGAEAVDFINELNADKKWVIYDKNTNTAKITSVDDFVKEHKIATRYPYGFDNPEIDNPLFGFDGKGAHFDAILSKILTEEKSKLAASYYADLKKKDSFGYTTLQRVDMYTPLYYLMKNEKGFGTSNVAKYWRINSGIEQPHTSLTTEVNLALALKHYDGVKSVDFTTVWGQGHTQAERKDNDISNFIRWVNKCMKNK